MNTITNRITKLCTDGTRYGLSDAENTELQTLLLLENDGKGDDSVCLICYQPITIGELCHECAKGNDPFVQSKYAMDTKP